MLFVVHAVDKTDMLPTRAKFYRAHRVHLDDAVNYDVDVVTAGTLVADDGETTVGSVFVIDAKDRAAVDAFNPYRSVTSPRTGTKRLRSVRLYSDAGRIGLNSSFSPRSANLPRPPTRLGAFSIQGKSVFLAFQCGGNGGTRCSRNGRMPLGGIQVATGVNGNGFGSSGRLHGHLYGGTRIRVSSILHRGNAQ
jgi:uncharacterized protein